MDDPFTSPLAARTPLQQHRPNVVVTSSLEHTPSPELLTPDLNTATLRTRLQAILDDKSRQLANVGSFGQRLLTQQSELEDRIKALGDEQDGDDISEDTRAKLRELEDAMKGWESDNQDIMRDLHGSEFLDVAMTPVPALATPVKANDTGPPPSTLTRRQRNVNQHRAMDMEFATEIGQNLLHEVRRLQALLNERDRTIAESKDAWEAERDTLVTAVRTAEANADQLKDVNWSLEVNLQELRGQHGDVTGSLTKATAEQNRLAKTLAAVREAAETHKLEAERQREIVEELKVKHETEMAQARKTHAGLTRDKSDLLNDLTRMRKDKEALDKRGVREGSPLVHSFTHDTSSDDVFNDDMSFRKRPGFDANDNALSPSQLYASDFDSPDNTPNKSMSRSPMGEMYAEELRIEYEKAQQEIAQLKEQLNSRQQVEDVDEFGAFGGAEESTLKARGGKTPSRGRRGRGGRGFASTISRKLGFPRSSSGLSASGSAADASFQSSPGTPDLLRPDRVGSPEHASPLARRGNLADSLGDDFDNASPTHSRNLSDSSFDALRLSRDLSRQSQDLTLAGPPLALELTQPSSSYADASVMTDDDDWSRQHTATIRPSETMRPSIPSMDRTSPARDVSGEVTPNTRTIPLPARPATADGFRTDTTDAETDFEDARETVGTLTPAYATATAGEDSSASDEDSDQDHSALMRRPGGFSGSLGATLGLGLGAAAVGTGFYEARRISRMKSSDKVRERTVESPIDREIVREVIKEVPVERIVEREVIKEVQVPVEVFVEKIVEKEVPVDRIVEKEVFVDRIVEKEVFVDRIVEKEVIKEVPVEKIVEKIVDRPVEVIVEKIVDRPVEVIVEKIVEKEVIKEVPVEVIKEVPVEIIKEVEVEKVVEKIVEVEKIVTKEVFVDRPVDKIIEIEKIVEKEVIKEVPVDRIVEKIIDRPVEVIVEKPVEVEKLVEKVVEVPKIIEVEKIVEKVVERQVEVPKIVEVEKIVERIVEVPVNVDVERIVEKQVIKEVPVDRMIEVEKIVEKIVETKIEVPVEVPVERIVEVEKIVEKTVEVPKEVIVERVVEKIVEVPVEVEKLVEKVVEKEVIKEVFVDRPVEVVVEKIVDRPVEVEKIVEKETIKTVEVPVEVIKEVPVEVIREIIKEVPVEVIKRVEVPVEVIKEVTKEVPFEVIKEIEVIKEVPVERIIEKEVVREVPVDRIVEKIVYKDAPVTVTETPATPARGRPQTPNRDRALTPTTRQLNVPTPTTSPGSPRTPDLGLFRVSPGANYDFLKSPPPPRERSRSPRLIEGNAAAGVPRSRDLSAEDGEDEGPSPPTPVTPSADRSRPPKMHLPPPPSAPPPPGTLVKKMSMGPPPVPVARAMSPADGIARAVSPTGSTYSRNRRSAPSSAGPAVRVANGTATIHPPQKLFRETSKASLRSQGGSRTTDADAWAKSRESVKRKATQVINEHPRQSTMSGYTSASSSVTDLRELREGAPSFTSSVDSLVAQRRGGAPRQPSTDPATIHAITQTMIGEYLHKYTRRTIGRGMSENRHKRFFWVHPYTKTLYWSSQDPGGGGATESKAKSVFISGIREIDDFNATPPGLYVKSIVISTLGREIQLTAPTKERHDLWLSALNFLLQQGTGTGGTLATRGTTERPRRLSVIPDEHGALRSPVKNQSRLSVRSVDREMLSTPRARPARPASAMSTSGRASSMRARASTAADTYMRRHAVPQPHFGGHRYKGAYKGAPISTATDYEEDDDPDASFEGLDNVRACCDGRHQVGGHVGGHHDSGRVTPATPIRPNTPGASIRSRASSILSTVRRSNAYN
ncbi:hypothetical protein CC85DRAFT_93486 [Cutaneotrichosporon oleaginosum]|uniref:PH domain-containing protein n=1 Tax=Cutaneotrichosporon oleaginosum TaxID=879819 RepID=A0A0J1B440_9TREE|nr:uncharacterized protein CC85DRAFT_93486 [Cutaneotrichosporon oleaginosum]KLT42389.1 hypothetical protein CC85DRAFT_93486 [Cutaneotrichosporon oleaginosum]TXT04208.1 hypothetical protein COLE_07905 [Cutaneotrichosporon oleaginosum]